MSLIYTKKNIFISGRALKGDMPERVENLYRIETD